MQVASWPGENDTTQEEACTLRFLLWSKALFTLFTAFTLTGWSMLVQAGPLCYLYFVVKEAGSSEAAGVEQF